MRAACLLVCRIFHHSPVFRVGGDEFVAILRGQDYVDRENLTAVLRRQVEENIRLNEGPVVAAGTAAFEPGTDRSVEDVMRRAEQAMLATYESEDDLRRVFTERSGILDNNIHTASYNVASVRDALVTLLAGAGNRELDGQPVSDKQAERIRARHAELVTQRRMQASFEQQRRALDVEIEGTLQRYRLLKGVGSDPRG
ncbi:MAG: diguanylate cyclase [Stenotrophomonas maltophilia]